MTKITPLSDITTLQNIAATINANNDKVEAALENTLSLDGSTPNSMGADLDLNSFSILNVTALNGVGVDTLSANLDIVAALSDDITEVANNAANISTVAADTIAINAASGNAAAAAASAADALVSEGNAAASEAAAAASYDSFDDRYLGAKAVEPTLDNDGDALLTGALYFNTVTEDMWVYTGTAWAVAYVSLGDALLANANLSDLDSATTALTNLGLTSNGKSLVTAANYASMRTLLGLGTAALTASTDYATAAQGALAGSALQSITKATMPEAQSGTGTGIMDATLTKAAIAALAVVPTTLYAVGTYITGRPANAANYVVNSLVAGSSLYQIADNVYWGLSNFTDQLAGDAHGAVLVGSGTWRCVSNALGSGGYGHNGLWVRVS